MRIFPDFTGSKKAVVGPERNFGLVDLHHALQRLAVGINHRSSQLLRQQPSRLVGDAELGLELDCRHAVRVRRHEMRGPEPHRQRQLRPVHHRPGRYRRLATAVEAFVGVRPAPQQRCASVATGRTDKPLRPTPLEQERRTARLVRKARLKTLSAIAPSPSRAPSRSAQIASARHPYTTYWPTWDNGMSLQRQSACCCSSNCVFCPSTTKLLPGGTGYCC